MARIVIFTYDRRLDRRAVLQANTLIAQGHNIVLYARADTRSDDPAYVVRIAESHDVNAYGAFSLIKLYAWFAHKMPYIYQRVLPILRPIYRWFMGINAVEHFMQMYRGTLATMEPANLYIAHDLPMLPIACEAQRLHGGQILYDSHELFCEQGFLRHERHYWQRVESQYIHRADAVITINASIAKELAVRYNVPLVHVVTNAENPLPPSPEKLRLFHEAFHLTENQYVLLYQGSLEFSYNISAVIKAMQFVPEHFHMVLLGSGTAIQQLQQRVHALRLSHRVHFHRAVMQSELLHYTASADAGIIPYLDTCLNARYCSPNKLYEYIAAGIPILASDLIEISVIISKYGNGLVTSMQDTHAIASGITAMFNPDTLAALKPHCRKAQQEITWSHEAITFVRIINDILDAARVSIPAPNEAA